MNAITCNKLLKYLGFFWVLLSPLPFFLLTQLTYLLEYFPFFFFVSLANGLAIWLLNNQLINHC